jgi:hypothetical protein
MHITSLEIESNDIHKLKRSFKKSGLTISSQTLWRSTTSSKDVEINNIHKSMVQAISGLTQVMGMMYSNGKPTTNFDYVVEEKNTEND